MASLLLRRIGYLVTFDDEDRELRDVDLLVEDGVVAAIGTGLSPAGDCEVLDASGHIVLPGLVNAHQHLYQVGMRSLSELERAPIVPWLGRLHEMATTWHRTGWFSPTAVGAVAKAGLVESLLGGVTTVADQHYVFPGGGTEPYIEEIIAASGEVGGRLHAGRGTMTMGRSDGGVAPDEACQTIDEALRHSVELIDAFHDPDPFSHLRIDLAPCGVHVDRPETFRELAALSGEREGVGLHTHLYEVVDTEYCRERYGTTPWAVLEEAGWARPGTWLAHVVDPPEHEIPSFAAAGVGIVHLVAPDLRMGFGLAPVRSFLDAGCCVGFGTTGSASNDGANQLGDLRVAALAHRLGSDDPASWPTARELLRAATRGSAGCLGRDRIGSLAPGMAADLAAWDMGTVDRVGVHDPVVGLLLTGLSDRASFVLVGGRVVVRDGRCVTVDEEEVAARARSAIPLR